MKKTHTDNTLQRFFVDRKEQLSITGVSVFADWMLVLTTLSLVFIGLLTWSWVLNRDVLTASSLQEDKVATVRSRVDEVLLERVTTSLQQKQNRFSEVTNGFVFNDRARVVTPVIEATSAATTTATTTTTATATTSLAQ